MPHLNVTQRRVLQAAAANPNWNNWDASRNRWEFNQRTVGALVAKGLLRQEGRGGREYALVLTDAGRAALPQ